MIIAIEGPEKTGKSTFASALSYITGAKVRHWGPISPDDRVYKNMLMEDTASNKWVIWDRCWPSEHIYGSLLNRNRRLSNDPWLGEWLHGRALQTNGIKVVILPSNIEDLIYKRDITDLPVHPIVEAKRYAEYAELYDWDIHINNYDNNSIDAFVHAILDKMNYIESRKEDDFGFKLSPPMYAGPIESKVVFVNRPSNVEFTPGGWMPFSNRYETLFARKLGNLALKCGWTSSYNQNLQHLQSKSVVACGDAALIYCSQMGVHKVLALPDITQLLKSYDEHSPEVEHVVNVTKLFCKGELENE